MPAWDEIKPSTINRQELWLEVLEVVELVEKVTRLVKPPEVTELAKAQEQELVKAREPEPLKADPLTVNIPREPLKAQ
ncbi:hypothetical protein MY4824_001507 [Beauveria thailandica]